MPEIRRKYDRRQRVRHCPICAKDWPMHRTYIGSRIGILRISGSSYLRWGLDSPPAIRSMRRR
jgi:hypothetical protein